ncbi:MAG: primosomal protein N' [Flavobacteriaceae bacterium]|nr:primosomal protein N' [Flavobacteriaceae bacterium]|tara:strand:+ start:30918 stop:33365 length:2448 start_codon:yes stop_codon:yes gene_type:complete
MEYFIEVIIPLSLDRTYTYSVSSKQNKDISIGCRVIVPFGKSKSYTAIVSKKNLEAPIYYSTKRIDCILDTSPVVNHLQLKFWQWISEYYQAAIGDVYRTAIPSAFLLESEMEISKNNFPKNLASLSDDEFLIYEALSISNLSVKEISGIIQKKHVLKILKEMLSKGYVKIDYNINEKYKPKRKRYIRLSEFYQSSDKIKVLLDSLVNAPKQLNFLNVFLNKNTNGKKWEDSVSLINRTNSDSSILRRLLDKDVLEETFKEEIRKLYNFKALSKKKLLSTSQNKALKKIKKGFLKKEVILFHGVTGSGKTEIYIQLIESELEKNKQILYLLPEISLTPQMVKRLQEKFGSKVAVYHSKFSIHERKEVWDQVLKNGSLSKIIIGTRSSIFLPFKDLGLIIIDEEHEYSYKQFDPSPRYNARDSAIILAGLYSSKVLLGSATPSIESYTNAIKSKYGLVNLNERYGGIELPEIKIVDLKEAYDKSLMKGFFSHTMLHEISKTLNAGKQIILFQNRRGYSPILECIACGSSPSCEQCDVTLTYHQFSANLKCHYCGYEKKMIKTCDSCGMGHFQTKGIGTQQVQEQIEELFPGVGVSRMDWDSTRGKWDFDKLISSFSKQETKILVGTQMVVKGLDFNNVHLVGVLNADQLFNFPDFRSNERAFQMLCQVSGRSGRKNKRGKVVIQTYQKTHHVIKAVSENNYESIFKTELNDRKLFNYPPYLKLIRIILKNKNIEIVKNASDWVYNILKHYFPGEILGPSYPYVIRVRNYYHMQILIKIEKKFSRKKTHQILKKCIESFHSIGKYRNTRVNIDVDPY